MSTMSDTLLVPVFGPTHSIQPIQSTPVGESQQLDSSSWTCRAIATTLWLAEEVDLPNVETPPGAPTK
jgi:hypothetical protein